jgi:predicted NUDIX family NTP pyrophosphohydrolase
VNRRALSAPTEPLRPLSEIRQRGGKRVHAFVVEGEIDVGAVASNTFEMEWPPRSGRLQTFPEIDRAERFDLRIANERSWPISDPFSITCGACRMRWKIKIGQSRRISGGPLAAGGILNRS